MVRRQSAEKRASILEAATQAFCDEGYETTSMDRIAERAGASKRTVYNYFASKEALFLAVVETLAAQRMAAKQIAWDPDRALDEQLAALARTKSIDADDPTESALTRMVFGVFVTHPELARTALGDWSDPLVPWLEAAAAAGQLVVPDPVVAAKLFWATASGALMWTPLIRGPISEDTRELLISEMVTTFLARYRPPTAT